MTSIKEILEKFDDLAEQVTETKYDYGIWGLSFDNLIEQLKSSIQKEFDELKLCLDIDEKSIIEASKKITNLQKTIKELEDKLKEQAKQIFDDIEEVFYPNTMSYDDKDYQKLKKKWCKE